MTAILLPVATVSILGLVCGLVLVTVSKVMHVPVDEKFTKVREALPGANCGACGFAGCDAYAQALASDPSVATNLCIPGGATAAAGIGEALGVKVEASEPKIATVKCQGNFTNTSDKMEYDGPRSCAASKMFFSGKGLCAYGCLGFGDCAAACPYNAICVGDGLAYVDPQKCVGCGVCVRTCPSRIIELVPASSKVYVACSSHDKGAVTRKNCKTGCIACRKCEKACPSGAITVEGNLARIDPEKCTNCGICVEECPVHAIRKR